MNDILIYSQSKVDHVRSVREVLNRLLEHQSTQHPSCSILILRMWHNKNHCDLVEVQ